MVISVVVMAALPAGAQPSSGGVVIAQADLQGLQAIRQSLVDPRGFLRGWNGTGIDACSGGWAGVKCGDGGKVVAIQLPFKGLAGALSDKVGQLTSLRKLSLHDNALGGQLPASLGFLPDLRAVYLFNNRFAGAVPPQLGGCKLLQTLDLSGNFLSGNIPASLANATRLFRLNLAYNNLTGVVPSNLASLPFLISLQLNNNNLSGEMPTAIGNLRLLQELSLSNNLISGSIPDGIGSLSKLQSLDLSTNLLSGSLPVSLFNLTSLVELKLDGNDIGGNIPDAIDGLKNLTKLSLRRNILDGEIPATVGNISTLSSLDVSENNLTGGIPESLSRLANLTSFNVSYNNLSGPVPVALSTKFNSTSFVGNIQLCGYNGSAICTSISSPGTMASPPLPLSQRPTRKLNKRELLFAVGGICLLFLLLFSCVLLFWRKDKQESESPKKGAKDATAKAAASKPAAASGGGGAGGDGGGKLVHFDGPLSFTADDLLCATAEILGKSTYGTVYKATMENGTFVAVKRLREKIAKSQKEFEAEVNALGKLRHPNLLALRAYYLGPKGEKLLVFDFMTKGNLASFLHARAPDSPVSWATRMNIAMGVARGLLHLHAEADIVHGNLTSNNILLDDDVSPKIADCGLSRLMNATANSNAVAAAGALGYRAPELAKLKKASNNAKSDIFSLGMIMLELLTGKSPGDTTNGLDLPQWVASVVEEEWTNEVFDLELMKDAAAGSEAGEELVKTLKLALHCVDPSPAARPDAQQVLRQLEQIKPSVAMSASSSFTGEPSQTIATATTVTDDTKSTITE
uniref:Protein kinase domain-containing protein n=1 Tax=Leersia perrieri TaxID=77586 RepID=A0A0D9VT08_9ORYZ